jgi:hypothetical protein
VKLVAVALAEKLGMPCMKAMSEEEAVSMDGDQFSKNGLTLKRN